MPFVDESESFTNGFECGQIWDKFERGEELQNYLCHTDNEKQIRKMAATFGKTISCHHEDEEAKWMVVWTETELKDLNNLLQ